MDGARVFYRLCGHPSDSGDCRGVTAALIHLSRGGRRAWPSLNRKKSAIEQLAGPEEPNLGDCILKGERVFLQGTYKYLGIIHTNKPEYLAEHLLLLRKAAIGKTNVLRKENLWKLQSVPRYKRTLETGHGTWTDLRQRCCVHSWGHAERAEATSERCWEASRTVPRGMAANEAVQ